MCTKLTTAAPDVPAVARAMKTARAIAQYFNKSTQAAKKLKISRESLPWPNIAVNQRASSRMSRLDSDRQIVC